MRPDWRPFEKAVTALTSAIDPSAKVTESARELDLETGMPRERDIWIEGKICNFIPMKVMVSCRQYHRKFRERDVDHFVDAMTSSGATNGIIYSFSGFSSRADEKARKKEVSCMRLHRNEPPAIPEALAVPHAFCCFPRIGLALLWKSDPSNELLTWNDVFPRPYGKPGSAKDVLDHLIGDFIEKQEGALQGAPRPKAMPSSWTTEILYVDTIDPAKRLMIRIGETWEVYGGKLKAHVANGRYSLTEKAFVEQIALPVMQMQGVAAGPDLNRFDPGTIDDASAVGISFVMHPTRQTMAMAFGDHELTAVDPAEFKSTSASAKT